MTHEDLIHVLMLKGSIIPVVLLWFYHIIYSEAEDMQLKTCVYFYIVVFFHKHHAAAGVTDTAGQEHI